MSSKRATRSASRHQVCSSQHCSYGYLQNDSAQRLLQVFMTLGAASQLLCTCRHRACSSSSDCPDTWLTGSCRLGSPCPHRIKFSYLFVSEPVQRGPFDDAQALIRRFWETMPTADLFLVAALIPSQTRLGTQDKNRHGTVATMPSKAQGYVSLSHISKVPPPPRNPLNSPAFSSLTSRIAKSGLVWNCLGRAQELLRPS